MQPRTHLRISRALIAAAAAGFLTTVALALYEGSQPDTSGCHPPFLPCDPSRGNNPQMGVLVFFIGLGAVLVLLVAWLLLRHRGRG